ncbi:MAG: hypothetical protein B7X84_05855 [Alphaproteobacteria bacterium 17-39-52]|nr:MAG: hypothetical protein B7X84_05855 [Alphaproteobacteria bacterium 17-39-52]
MTDQQSGQTIDHLQMIQIELPRAKKTLFPPSNTFTEQDWWLSLFKHATEYKSADLEGMVSQGLIIPDVINKALDRLRLSKWVPGLVHAYEKETVDFNEYATMFATERAEGRAEGELKVRRSVALNLLAQQVAFSVISAATGFSEEEVEALKSETQ